MDRSVRIVFVAALFTPAACSPSPRDVAYYRAHPGERAQMVASCHKAEGHFAASTDCLHAFAADGEAATKAFLTVHSPSSRVQHPGKL